MRVEWSPAGASRVVASSNLVGLANYPNKIRHEIFPILGHESQGAYDDKQEALSYQTRSIGLQGVPFTFSTLSPVVLGTLVPGTVISRVIMTVVTPFSDPNATILLGTSADPSQFFSAPDSTLEVMGQYTSDELTEILAPDYLILTIIPLTSVSGIGKVYYEIR